MSPEIRILIVDDHALFRESVSRLLQTEPDFRVVGAIGSLQEGLQLIEAGKPDVVLLDYLLDGKLGTPFLESAKASGFKGRILIVTAGMPGKMMLHVLEQGASGILLKHASPTELIQVIHRIASGQMWLDSRVIRPLIDAVQLKEREDPEQASLNARELAVLRAVFEGLANKEIAGKLQLSESTIKVLLQKLYAKAGVRTRSQLVRVTLEGRFREWFSGA